MIKKEFPASKIKIRNFLRKQNKDHEFTTLQAEVYGPMILKATPYPGVLKVLKHLNKQSIEKFIVSHKTIYPYKGPRYKLRDYALSWMKKNNFFSKDDLNWNRDKIFFEETIENKVERIKKLGCTHYIDDLTEVLNLLPQNIIRIHFSPTEKVIWDKGETIRNWNEFLTFFDSN